MPLRLFSSFNSDFSYASQVRLENEIRTALSKLTRISEIMPETDAQRKQKAVSDLKDLEA